MRILSLYRFASRKAEIAQLKKLVFDEQDKALIYKHLNGEETLKWCMRGGTIYTLLNAFLMMGEYVQPIFGGWNGTTFGISTFIGATGFIMLHVFSRRTVEEIRLLKSGEFVEIKFFNAFWAPKLMTVHCSEFQDLYPSYLGFHKVDLTSVGKIWINLEKNSSVTSDKKGFDILLSLLNGNPIKVDALKFSKKYLKH